MTTFDERERGFEAKFAHDEELRYLVAARRDKLFAQWAAEQLRMSGAGGAELTASVLAVPDGPAHAKLLFKHVAKAFSDRGRTVREADLTEALDACAVQAQQQLLGEPIRVR